MELSLPNGLRIGRYARLDAPMYIVSAREQWLELAKAENAEDEAGLKAIVDCDHPVQLDSATRLLIVDYSATVIPALIDREGRNRLGSGQSTHG